LRLEQRGERAGAPLQVGLELDWVGTSVLEGSLWLDFYQGNRLLGTYGTVELALAPGTQRFAAVLPAMSVRETGQYVTARPRFQGKKGTTFPLDPVLLSVPDAKERSLLVCAPEPDLGALGDAARSFSRAVRFEQWNPVPGDRSLVTSFVRPPDGELPDSPLGYLPFDLVLLTHEAFRGLEEAQLAALADWIEGGGSALIVPRGVYRERHRQFLDRLALSAGSAERFATDGAGRFLRAPAGSVQGLVKLRAGLGRTVVALPPEEVGVDFEHRSWREAALFLWKVRRERADEIFAEGSWSVPRAKPKYQVWSAGDVSEEPGAKESLPLGMTRLPLVDWLVPRLLERTVRIMPFGPIVAVLAVFVLLVGPLDWYLLGYLRKRKWTWVLFPAISVAVTLFMLLLTRHYLGTATLRRSLVLVDVGPEGAAQRENRFELIFAATPERLVHEPRGSLLQPLGAPGDEAARWAIAAGGEEARWRGGVSAAVRTAPEPVWIEGKFPDRYTLRQSVLQWKAQVNRSLSFSPADRGFSPRWEEFQELFPLLGEKEPRIEDDLVGRFLEGQEPRCRIAVLHLDRRLEWSAERKGRERRRLLPTFISAHPRSGLFNLVAATSPTGSGNLEDLALLDPTDPREFLLLVEREVGDEVIVHRKLYRRGD
jgi:hypothetical protein